MSHIDGYILTCPECSFTDNADKFEPSLADECFCPECGEKFIFGWDDMDDLDDDSELDEWDN